MIKFRAWDIRNKRWMTPEIENEEESEIRLDLWGNVLFRLPWHEQSEGSIVTVYANDVFKIMQSTGLKDKNGVEIYEGDIVKIENHPFHTHIQIDGNYEVGINERKELCAGGWLLYEALSYASVIGSIYENPELLEVVE